MKKTLYLFAVLAIAFQLSSCSTLYPSGNLVESVKAVGDFTKVDVASAVEAYVVPGEKTALTIKCSDNVMPHIIVKEINGELKIYLKNGVHLMNGDVTAYITVKYLSGVDASGASRVYLDKDLVYMPSFDVDLSGASVLEGATIIAEHVDFDLSGASRGTVAVVANQFDIELSGASALESALNVNRVVCNATGASGLNLEGVVTEFDMELSGASQQKGYDLVVNRLLLEMSGASRSVVTVTDYLEYELSGASVLNYKGRPVIGKSESNGGSIVNNE